jgi:hypothetical protein
VRHQALHRLTDHANSLRANAVLSVRFDTSEMGVAMTEVLAYGTAVVAKPETTASLPVFLRSSAPARQRRAVGNPVRALASDEGGGALAELLPSACESY